MNTATADGSRALYGISKDGLSIKQLGRLNRWNVPGFAMSCDTVHQHPVRALHRQHLRHPRGEQHRLRPGARVRALRVHPAAKGPAQLATADQAGQLLDSRSPAVLCAMFIVFTVVGVGWFQIAAGGYGKGAQVKIIGFGVLVISLLLFFYRRRRAGQGVGCTGGRRLPRCPTIFRPSGHRPRPSRAPKNSNERGRREPPSLMPRLGRTRWRPRPVARKARGSGGRPATPPAAPTGRRGRSASPSSSTASTTPSGARATTVRSGATRSSAW